MPVGGKRDGAGRPKGSKNTATRTKEEAREFVRQMVIAEMSPMVSAQIEQAKGLKYLVTRDKASGKFIRVGPAMAAEPGEQTIEVWEKDPSVQAFTDLMNRALDKPAEQVQEILHSGELSVRWLTE